VKGPQSALIDAQKLNLDNNHFYFVLLGELYRTIDTNQAKLNFQKAYSIAKTKTEKEGIQRKIDFL
jgi:RNA polymerase sigma-70 factor (ECF subfamily)